ncbi:hypothetical protein NLG97_g930 [Lecanicillium saksenae]|uniref:Uncharacterized protein n=1 Tax=Lecanicillium saksenae TaxID=468837 RepID=A0ACC1R7T7_9HYPO|nr:hypothetical protein NLG97_g930 [Lecanicillium saksenae]
MSHNNSRCSAAEEDVFGPTVHGSCLESFDFTLLFEEGILAIAPLAIATIWGLLRCSALRREPSKALRSWHLAAKLFLYAVYSALQAALFALWLRLDAVRTRLTMACTALILVGHLFLAIVSYLEHTRSVRPSTVILVYLGLSIVLDLPRTRTLFFISGTHTVAVTWLASVGLKILLFLLELCEKQSLLKPEFRQESPEALASVYNRALFIWLNGLFLKGFRSILSIKELISLDSQLLGASEPETLEERWVKDDKVRKDALLWLFVFHYKWALLRGVLPRIAFTGFNFAQPYLVQRVLDFVSDRTGTNERNYAYGLLSAYGIVYIGIAVSYTAYTHATYRLLTLYRGSLIALIFHKALHTCSSSPDNAEAITLISADIDRIGSSITLIHETYGSCMDLILALWLLYKFLGVAMAAPIVWTLVCLLVGLPLAAAAGNAQVPWLEAIEERLSITAKALTGLKPMKMMGLTDVVSDKIAQSRLDEIQASRRYRILSIFLSIFRLIVRVTGIGASSFTPVWGFAVYILRAKANDTGTLTDSVAFAALSLFELVNQPMSFLVHGFEDVQIIVNSFRRAQEYLLSEGHEDYRAISQSVNSSAELAISLEKTTTEAVSDSKKTSGQELDQNRPQAVAVVKDVSAGYGVEDDPVLKNLNFQVLRGRITMVLGPVGCGKSTLLKLLLGELPSVNGEVSTTFKHAAFCPQTPWTIWGTIRHNIVAFAQWNKNWYDVVIYACALLRDFNELPDGDQAMTGSCGSRLSGGQKLRVSLARALFSRQEIMVLDDVLSGMDRTTEYSILNGVFGPDGLVKKMNTTVLMATSSAQHVKFADYVIVIDKSGHIAQQGVPQDVFKGKMPPEVLHTQPYAIPSSLPSHLESVLAQDMLPELNALEDKDFDTSRSTGDMKVYVHYARAAGWWTMATYVLACAMFVFGSIFPSVWLQWWTNSNETQPNNRLGYWLFIYGLLSALTLGGCALSDCALNLLVRPRTAWKYHNILLITTMRAAASVLSDTNSGTTLNRFSQDLELIDNDLPAAIDSTLFQLLSAIVSTVLVFIGSGYVAAAIPACILVLGFLQLYYLRTSRQLRLLDIEAKAPLFSKFLETLNGISSIRAYGWAKCSRDSLTSALNVSQKPYYLMWCIQRWLTLVLDLLVAGIGFILVAIATTVQDKGSTGFLGVALFNVVTFSSTLQSLVQSWTQMETALGAINRIVAYAKNVKDENMAIETGRVPADWPSRGQITFQNVSAGYETGSESVLTNINFSIAPGEKVAICGRTGSGKSTLIATLLRTADITSGTVSIDGIDISTCPRQQLRKHLNTIPQEPFFLHGTLRENMDPFKVSTDQEIEHRLSDVGMWSWFDSRGELDWVVDPKVLSEGQRQLLCFARATLQKSSILVMDEPTSSTDDATDAIIQQALQKHFPTQTVVAVAHKLHTILDYDRVILLDKGEVIEIGNPGELLTTPESAFAKLSASLGKPSELEVVAEKGSSGEATKLFSK